MRGRVQALVPRLLGALLGEAMLVCGACAGSITVATYIVENYVAADRRVDEVYRQGYPKPEAAKTALRAVIRALDADVAGAAGDGPAGYLEEIAERFGGGGPGIILTWRLAEAVDTGPACGGAFADPLLPGLQTHADLAFRHLTGQTR